MGATYRIKRSVHPHGGHLLEDAHASARGGIIGWVRLSSGERAPHVYLHEELEPPGSLYLAMARMAAVVALCERLLRAVGLIVLWGWIAFGIVFMLFALVAGWL